MQEWGVVLARSFGYMAPKAVYILTLMPRNSALLFKTKVSVIRLVLQAPEVMAGCC